MFTACIPCNAPLGRNEFIEPFPIWRRLAFDAARGRLWVVCRLCGRWNLTPMEERGRRSRPASAGSGRHRSGSQPTTSGWRGWAKASIEGSPTSSRVGLGQLDAVQIAALEMASHEEAQRRRAFEGELSQLENAWPEAEEIAAIADNPSVEEWNERQRVRLRSRGAGPAGPVG